jgi:hypothetical protein
MPPGHHAPVASYSTSLCDVSFDIITDMYVYRTFRLFLRYNAIHLLEQHDCHSYSLQVSLLLLLIGFTSHFIRQLQAAGAVALGSIQFSDLSQTYTPDIGTVSSTVRVTLTEQGSVEYVRKADMQQLARLLLARELMPGADLVNSTLQVGQPVVEGTGDLGIVTLKVAAAGIEEYQYSPAQLQAMQNHIRGPFSLQVRISL